MLMNMKGGVGKTTLAVEFSRAFAYLYDKNVLLIDYDPQANASFAWIENAEYFALLEEGKSVADCLMPQISENDPFNVVGINRSNAVDHGDYTETVRNWYYKNDKTKKAGRLDLLPGNLEMMRIALTPLSSQQQSTLYSRWEALMSSARGAYDCVIIDCHPAGSFFTQSALLASDAAIIPVTSDAYAATGLRMMRRHMEMWEPAGGAKEFLVVFNEAQQGWDAEVEASIRGDDRFANHCLSNRIPYSRLLKNQANRRKTAIEQPVANRWKVGENVNNVAKEMVNLLKEREIFETTWRELR